jgi:hypothetical protein
VLRRKAPPGARKGAGWESVGRGSIFTSGRKKGGPWQRHDAVAAGGMFKFKASGCLYSKSVPVIQCDIRDMPPALVGSEEAN